jgi:SET domain-containing protein
VRRGQSKRYRDRQHYKKGDKVHKYSPSRDRRIKARHTRKRGDASWRGDLPGRRI